MTRIDPAQRCTCSRSRPSGLFYYGREACRACGLFIVLSTSEREQLERAEERASRDEYRRALRQLQDLDVDVVANGNALATEAGR